MFPWVFGTRHCWTLVMRSTSVLLTGFARHFEYAPWYGSNEKDANKLAKAVRKIGQTKTKWTQMEPSQRVESENTPQHMVRFLGFRGGNEALGGGKASSRMQLQANAATTRDCENPLGFQEQKTMFRVAQDARFLWQVPWQKFAVNIEQKCGKYSRKHVHTCEK